MKLGPLNHIGVATPSIADSIVLYRGVMVAATSTRHYNDLIM
jgi:methylmalonyl-CoA/ethylmalonyl-CoA epimerase